LSVTERAIRAARCRRGQAATETLLLTLLMVVFFASTYQLFLANHSIYRTLAATHQQLFEEGFAHNCAVGGDNSIFSEADIPGLIQEVMRLLGLPPISGSATACRYQKNPAHATVVWNDQDFPEIHIQVVGLLKRHGLSDPLFLEPRTVQMGAGPEGPGDGLGHLQGLPRFTAKTLSTTQWAVENLVNGNIIRWELERIRPFP
jgi:hypothetical protein